MAHQGTSFRPSGWRFARWEEGKQEVAASSAAVDPEAFADDRGPGVLLSPIFWLGSIASIAVWTGIWTGIAWVLDQI